MICPRCGADGDPSPCRSCGHDRNVGRRLGDRFVLGAKLGGGGMGSIYRAEDERLGEAVAIKLLRAGAKEDGVLRERFRREARALAKLRHPGIVSVLDVGEADGDLYTVLELVPGTTLDALGPIAPIRTPAIFDQVLAALEICHDHAIVHRDLKPSNLMVTTANGADRVKLIDFGLARVASGNAETLTETGTVQGTPRYMAPEQCRGEEVSPATDVYAAGIVFWEVLAGTAPFDGNDAATFMAQHLFASPPSLRDLAPSVSPGLAAAIHSALAKQPSDRPTAGALRGAIAAAFAGTDATTTAIAAAEARHRANGLSRSDRAIAPPGAPEGTAREGGHVVVWMTKTARSDALRGCLATAGFACSLWARTEPPVPGAGVVVIVSAREHADIAGLGAPVVVVDVAGPEETTAAIRAGASDMLLRGAPDAEIVPKLRRLLRRRGRP